jgi:hypothetical protein
MSANAHACFADADFDLSNPTPSDDAAPIPTSKRRRLSKHIIDDESQDGMGGGSKEDTAGQTVLAGEEDYKDEWAKMLAEESAKKAARDARGPAARAGYAGLTTPAWVLCVCSSYSGLWATTYVPACVLR